MRIWVVLAVVLVGCDGGPDPAPDALPPEVCAGAEPADYCEAINEVPECSSSVCGDACLVRVCDTERICQNWDDCVSPNEPEPHPCFQCRTLFWCECQPR